MSNNNKNKKKDNNNKGLLVYVPPALPNAAERQLLESKVELYLSVLDRDTAREYTTALEQVPHLVQAESRVIDFLRCEGLDPMAAALWLARYWKARKMYVCIVSFFVMLLHCITLLSLLLFAFDAHPHCTIQHFGRRPLVIAHDPNRPGGLGFHPSGNFALGLHGARALQWRQRFGNHV